MRFPTKLPLFAPVLGWSIAAFRDFAQLLVKGEAVRIAASAIAPFHNTPSRTSVALMDSKLAVARPSHSNKRSNFNRARYSAPSRYPSYVVPGCHSEHPSTPRQPAAALLLHKIHVPQCLLADRLAPACSEPPRIEALKAHPHKVYLSTLGSISARKRSYHITLLLAGKPHLRRDNKYLLHLAFIPP